MSLYSMIAMVPNNPYDVMGSWCGNSAWLYGNLVPLADTFDIDAEIRSDSRDSRLANLIAPFIILFYSGL